MKIHELDTKDVTVTNTEKWYVLNEKVFELDTCPDWAQYAVVNRKGDGNWYSEKPYVCGDISGWWANKGRVGVIHADRLSIPPTGYIVLSSVRKERRLKLLWRTSRRNTDAKSRL